MAARLGMLGTALQMYKVDQGRYPDSLEALQSGKNAYIQNVPCDHTGRPLLYFGSVGPREIMAAASAPLRGQRAALLGDASVRNMPEPEFQKRIAEQRGRKKAAETLQH